MQFKIKIGEILTLEENEKDFFLRLDSFESMMQLPGNTKISWKVGFPDFWTEDPVSFIQVSIEYPLIQHCQLPQYKKNVILWIWVRHFGRSLVLGGVKGFSDHSLAYQAIILGTASWVVFLGIDVLVNFS